MSYRDALTRANVAAFDMGMVRGQDFLSPTMDFFERDLTGATLRFVIGETPDPTTGTLLDIAIPGGSITMDLASTYQSYIDDCKYEAEWIPCDQVATDPVDLSTIALSFDSSYFSGMPPAESLVEGAKFYYAVRQTAPSNDVIVAGRFYLTEAPQ